MRADTTLATFAAMDDWLKHSAPGDLPRKIGAQRRDSSREDVEDAVQDVFLRVLERLRSRAAPAAPASPAAYLRRAVNNRLNSMHRARRREVTMDSTDDRTDLRADDDPTPEDLAEGRERAALFAMLARAFMDEPGEAEDRRLALAFAALQHALREKLTDRQWILIRMRVLEQIGVVECARLLGVSVGSAHNWTHSALAICKETLEAHDLDPGFFCYPEEGAE